MAKDPAVLFYTSDFLAGTSYFTDEQRGQYITLLCQQHQLGMIPENHMIFICKSLDSPVVKKFVRKNGFFYNERMRLEAEKRANYCESRAKNKKGHLKEKTYEKHMSVHMENGNGNDNVIINKKDRVIGKGEFEEIWAKYPNKDGKKAAERYFLASVKTEKDWHDIQKALQNYLGSKKVKDGYIKNGSTWFNNWQDWIDYKEPITEKDKWVTP